MRNLLPSLFLSTLAVIAPVEAGVIYEFSHVDHSRTPAREETIRASVDLGQLNMDIPKGNRLSQGTLLFRSRPSELQVLDHDRKSYVALDPELVERLAGLANSSSKAKSGNLDKVDDHQRSRIADVMQRRQPKIEAQKEPTVTFEKTSERATHQGYPCTKYVVRRDGQKAREVWVTDWNGIDKAAADVLQSFATFFGAVGSSVPRISRAGAGFEGNVFEDAHRLGGFPVLTREFDSDGTLLSEMTLLSAKSEDIAKKSFEVPEGYQQREIRRAR